MTISMAPVMISVIAMVFVIMVKVIAIVTAGLYYDIRIRKEGFDIEQMAAAMPAPLTGGVGA